MKMIFKILRVLLSWYLEVCRTEHWGLWLTGLQWVSLSQPCSHSSEVETWTETWRITIIQCVPTIMTQQQSRCRLYQQCLSMISQSWSGNRGPMIIGLYCILIYYTMLIPIKTVCPPVSSVCLVILIVMTKITLIWAGAGHIVHCSWQVWNNNFTGKCFFWRFEKLAYICTGKNIFEFF